jgi:hypothetical protein
MQAPTSAGFTNFANQVKQAYPGGWPIETSGGFVATAWYSQDGSVFAYVENPIESPGVFHTARNGTIKLRLPGLTNECAVVDLMGAAPDPNRLPDDQVSLDGEWLSFNLNWQYGDGRLFWIDSKLPVASGPRVLRPSVRPGYRVRYANNRLLVNVTSEGARSVTVYTVAGQSVLNRDISQPGAYAFDLRGCASGRYLLVVREGRKVNYSLVFLHM